MLYTMNMKLSICLLAAGVGQRLKWPSGKPMVPFLGVPLIDHSIVRCLEIFDSIGLDHQGTLGFVLGHKKEEVLTHLEKVPALKKRPYFWAEQKELLGTADALKAYFAYLPQDSTSTYTLVTCVDTPLITTDEMLSLWNAIRKDPDLDMIIGTFKTQNNTGLGRIKKLSPGVVRIIEEKDATFEEKFINEVNSGMYIFKTDFLKKALANITPSPVTKEYYLTNTCLYTNNAIAFEFPKEEHFLGINTPQERHRVQKIYETTIREQLMAKGVVLYHPENTYFHGTIKVGEGCIIYPNVIFSGHVELGDFVTIHSNCVIHNTTIRNNVEIFENTSIDSATIDDSSSIGPFARIRPQSLIGKKVKIGNFVETKKVELADEVKISHLSYVGDATIGSKTNIGCGFITCNYDGANKHQTTIGENCFIGSDSQMIAPVKIGNNCFVASGSTINKDMPDESFAIARAKMELKLNMAKKFLK